MMEISICFSWALEPLTLLYQFFSGCFNYEFIKHICYGKKSQEKNDKVFMTFVMIT